MPRPTDKLVERLRECCVGHPYTKIQWPHRILNEAAERIEELEHALSIEARTEYAAQCTIREESREIAKAAVRFLDARDEAIETADAMVKELETKDERIAELEAQVVRSEARNERMTQYVDDACECSRCCECQGWNPECSILATKRHKGIDIVTGKQLRSAVEGE